MSKRGRDDGSKRGSSGGQGGSRGSRDGGAGKRSAQGGERSGRTSGGDQRGGDDRPFFKPRKAGESKGFGQGGPKPEVEYRDSILTPRQRDDVQKARIATDIAIQEWLEQARVAAEKYKKLPPENRPLIERLDPWQREAYEALMNGEHVVVELAA
ncbi:MAG: hypothetical protein EOP09_18755, partial [Proteobacteria bacterium]